MCFMLYLPLEEWNSVEIVRTGPRASLIGFLWLITLSYSRAVLTCLLCPLRSLPGTLHIISPWFDFMDMCVYFCTIHSFGNALGTQGLTYCLAWCLQVGNWVIFRSFCGWMVKYMNKNVYIYIFLEGYSSAHESQPYIYIYTQSVIP